MRCGLGNACTDVLAQVLGVDPTGRQVGAACSCASKGRVELGREPFVHLKLGGGGFHPRGGDRLRLRALKPALRDQQFGLARVDFVLDVRGAPPDDAVKRSTVLCVSGSRPKARADGQFVLFGKSLFEPVELGLWSARRKGVPVHRAHYALLGVTKYVRTGVSLTKA